MYIKEYQSKHKRLNLEKFIELDEKMITYDFLRQGGEPDECALSRSIYEVIYPWYDETMYRGDTINTYRTAIRVYNDEFYVRKTQDERDNVLNIIQSHTKHHGDYLFEFDRFERTRQVCNNYQLGNFCVFPRGKINAARARYPYNDFFDCYLVCVQRFYNHELNDEVYLSQQIHECQDYFLSFDGFEDYVEKNYFQDFIDEHGTIIPLSKSDSFEDYVKTINSIIQKRGKRIADVLKKAD